MNAKEKLLAAFKGNISDENYQQLETMLAENKTLPKDVFKLFKLKEMTAEMINAYLDEEVAKLFPRRGFIEWGCYDDTLSELFNNPNVEVITKRRYDETWYEIYHTYFTVNGKFYKHVYSSPRSFSGGGTTSYSVEQVDENEVPSRITHVATVIGFSNYGDAGFAAQHCGSLEECEKWMDWAINRYGNKYKYRIFEV